MIEEYLLLTHLSILYIIASLAIGILILIFDGVPFVFFLL